MLPSEVIKQSQNIKDFLKNLGIPTEKIQDEKLLLQAFVHKSFASDFKKSVLHNERLEFLGDGVLSASINKFLFINYPEYTESDLTLYKIALVREETLAKVAKEIALDKYIFVSNGEERTQGREKNAILSDCLESLIGFIYLDLGLDATEKFISTYIFSKISSISKDPVKSYKTMTQEYLQKKFKETPTYKDIEYKKDEKENVLIYLSEIYLGEQKLAEGSWSNKKKAQEEAAKNYYTSLEDKEN
jgi:ribonuclease III